MNYKLWFWTVNILSAALKLLITNKTWLIIREIYHPSYVNLFSSTPLESHPLISYIINITALPFGSTEFAARLCIILIFFLTTWIFFICTKKLYDERTAFYGVLLLNIIPPFYFLIPVINIRSFILTLLYMISFLIFISLIETNNKNYWYLLSITTGFAVLCTYNGISIVFSVFLFLIFSSKHRFWLKKKETYSLFILSAVIFLINTIHSKAPLRSQLNYIFENCLPKSYPLFLKDSITIHMKYIFPILFLISTVSLFLCIIKTYKEKDTKALILFCFSLPPLIFFNTAALPYYASGGYLVLSIYTAHLTSRLLNIKWSKIKIYSCAVCTLALFTIIIVHLCAMHRIIQSEKLILNLKRHKQDIFLLHDGAKKYTVHKNKNSLLDKLLHKFRYQRFYTALLAAYGNFRNKLLKLDHSVFRFINSNLKSKYLDILIAPISYFDSKNFNLSFFIILTLCISILWKNQKNDFWIKIVLMASIIILGAAIVHFLKHYLARPRPLQEFGSDVNIIYEKVYANSFPSGHTELAFSLCVFMFIMVKKYWYIYIFFALASGFYRIYAGNHYPSDILGGAAIGIFCAYAVIYLFKKYKNFK